MTEDFIPHIGADVLFVAPVPGGVQHIAAKITALEQASLPNGQQVEVAIMTLFPRNGFLTGQAAPHDQLGKAAGTYHFAKPSRLVGANGNRISA